MILGTILLMVHSLLHYYLCFPAHIGTGFQIQAVPMAQVNATVQTAAAPPVLTPAFARGLGGSQIKNHGSQIGKQFGRKKRSAQFNNFGSQTGQQIGGGFGVPTFHGE